MMSSEKRKIKPAAKTKGCAAKNLPAIPLLARFEKPLPGMLKIGDVARLVDLSVQTIRLYEAEGLLISFKSSKGTRWYSEANIRWIQEIQELLTEGVNFAGIRRLLAQLPCWEIKPCNQEQRDNCSMRTEGRLPCWISPSKLCLEQLKECFHCATYNQAAEFINLKTRARILPKNHPPFPPK
jgi:MerR family transcriptional regulator/heat shock protein HspR